MSAPTLSYAVHSLDKLLLLPAGSVLSNETMDALIFSNRAGFYQTYSLLQHGSVKEDLLNFLGQPPYHRIFSGQRQIKELLNLMDNVYLLLPVLQSLDYFKLNDSYTYRHILMVFSLSTLLAKDLMSDYQDQIREISTSPNHDFGKICVPVHILRKSAPLTRSELNIMKHHALAGYVLLCYYLKDTSNIAAIVARDHHERKDCSGYPCGIPLADRMVEIIAVSDIYDALISPRPYRPVSYDNRTALEEVTKMAERNEIGWEVVKALVSHNRKEKPHYSESKVSSEKRGASPPGNLYGVIDEGKGNPQDPSHNPLLYES
ncbi:MAG: HD domain-containing phosphohydrolase [Nitrospirota bacterium]